ncbi:MAG TPA: 1-deoxy-D-xylulose-5-phosphate synthase N-terminal domain-containing protein [Desulfitobacteriaceae bacterium]|nr:1-deoxy-D-xylulose-5-phosphate synthase N-terminal domain-containing protein [Desulfitobacteriaceae bacterium]
MKQEIIINRHKQENCWQAEVCRAARGIRRRVLEHTVKNNGGYLSQACSAAEILATLYMRVMNLAQLEQPLAPPPFQGVPGPRQQEHLTGSCFNGPKGPEWDRFFLSPSQYALVLYATLIEAGRMIPEGLERFNQDGSTVEMIGAEHSPGHEIMSGSLGQGISQAAGIALGRRLKKEPGKVWVFMSDGEFQSGQTLEALQAMAYHKLDNMCIYVDVNGCQCDGPMREVMNIEPLEKRLEGFNLRVFRIDGHDIEALAALGCLKPDGRPTVILCDTSSSQGLPILKQRAPKFHYVRFTQAEEREAYRQVLEQMKLDEGSAREKAAEGKPDEENK